MPPADPQGRRESPASAGVSSRSHRDRACPYPTPKTKVTQYGYSPCSSPTLTLLPHRQAPTHRGSAEPRHERSECLRRTRRDAGESPAQAGVSPRSPQDRTRPQLKERIGVQPLFLTNHHAPAAQAATSPHRGSPEHRHERSECPRRTRRAAGESPAQAGVSIRSRRIGQPSPQNNRRSSQPGEPGAKGVSAASIFRMANSPGKKPQGIRPIPIPVSIRQGLPTSAGASS